MFLFRHVFRRQVRHIWILPHSLQFPNEIIRILEMPIDTRKPDVSYLVEFAEIVHDLLANESALHFGLKCRFDVAFNLGNKRRDLCITDLPFPAGTFKPLPKFLAVKRNT